MHNSIQLPSTVAHHHHSQNSLYEIKSSLKNRISSHTHKKQQLRDQNSKKNKTQAQHKLKQFKIEQICSNQSLSHEIDRNTKGNKKTERILTDAKNGRYSSYLDMTKIDNTFYNNKHNKSINSKSQATVTHTTYNKNINNWIKTRRNISQMTQKPKCPEIDLQLKGESKSIKEGHTQRINSKTNRDGLSNFQRLKKQAEILEKSNIIFGNYVDTPLNNKRTACKKRTKKFPKAKQPTKMSNLPPKSSCEEISMESYLIKEKLISNKKSDNTVGPPHIKSIQLQNDQMQKMQNLSVDSNPEDHFCQCSKCLKEKQFQQMKMKKYLYTTQEYNLIVPEQPYIVNNTFKNTNTKKLSVMDKQRNNIKRLNHNKSKIVHQDLRNQNKQMRTNSEILAQNDLEGQKKLYYEFYEGQPAVTKEQVVQVNNTLNQKIDINSFLAVIGTQNRIERANELNVDFSTLTKIHEIGQQRRIKTETQQNLNEDIKLNFTGKHQDFVKKRAAQVATAAKKFYQQNHHVNITNILREFHQASVSSIAKDGDNEQNNKGQKRKRMKFNHHEKLQLGNNLKIKGIELRDKSTNLSNTEDRSKSTENKRVLSHNKNILNNNNSQKEINFQNLKEQGKVKKRSVKVLSIDEPVDETIKNQLQTAARNTLIKQYLLSREQTVKAATKNSIKNNPRLQTSKSKKQFVLICV